MEKLNWGYKPTLRTLLLRYKKIKCIHDKATRKTMLDDYKGEIVIARKKLQEEGIRSIAHIIIPDLKRTEYCTIIYNEPFEFDGTKDELDTYLWENIATRITPSPYDCTGQRFTTSFKIGHIKGNLWKVAENQSIDV